MPRLRDRIAAWLVPPPVSVTIPAIGRLPRLIAWLGQDLVGDEDHRLVAVSDSPGDASGSSGGWRVRCEPIREMTSRTSAIRSRK